MLGLLIVVVYVTLLAIAVGVIGRHLDDVREARPRSEEDGRRRRAVTFISVGIATIWFLLVAASGMQQSSALFVGVPAALAIATVILVTSRSAVGVACKALTVALLVSLMFLGEGMLCVFMAAPLMYAVAIAIGAIVDKARQSNDLASRRLHSIALLALLTTSVEGVTGITSFDRHVSVTETRVVHASAADVAAALKTTPRFDRALPPWLTVGFPRPTSVRIEEGSGPARWVVRFRGGEMRLDGQEPHPGDLVLELVEERPRFMRWRAMSDTSHMTHYLRWRESAVTWEPIDGRTTRVVWTTEYTRGLDPAWYFGPLERFAVSLATGYLIESVATP